MGRWLVRSIIDDRVAFFLGMAGIAATLLLVLLFKAVFAGEAARIVAYPERMNADVWVMQKGVANMHMASSLIWDSKRTEVARLGGVERVTPILYLNTAVVAGGRRWFAYVVGIEAGDARAGPWKLRSGRLPRTRDEIVLPDVIANLTGLEIGRHARISDRELTVVGLSEGTFSMANSVVFVTLDALREITGARSSHSYLLVDLEPGLDADTAARRIEEAVTGVHAMPAAAFIASDRAMALRMGVELIGLMTVVGSLLAGVLSVFSVQAFIARRLPDLVVCKALGAGTGRLALSALALALALSAGGVGGAVIAGAALARVSAFVLPAVSLALAPYMVIDLVVIAGAGALVAAAFAALRLAAIDPAQAFAA